MKAHLDTDIGGDIDDLCALALLLRWPGVEVTGITTVAEENGRRAGYAKYALALAQRTDSSWPLGCFRFHLGYDGVSEERQRSTCLSVELGTTDSCESVPAFSCDAGALPGMSGYSPTPVNRRGDTATVHSLAALPTPEWLR